MCCFMKESIACSTPQGTKQASLQCELGAYLCASEQVSVEQGAHVTLLTANTQEVQKVLPRFSSMILWQPPPSLCMHA